MGARAAIVRHILLVARFYLEGQKPLIHIAYRRECVPENGNLRPVLALRFVAAISLFESIQHGDAAAFRLLADSGDE